MVKQTTPEQRRMYYKRHMQGETYREIAQSSGVSKECVRKWCRRQRDGGDCQSRYSRDRAGLLSQFEPLVRYGVLRLRLEHPRWGPNRILARSKKRRSLRGYRLPSETSIGRYLGQWPRFRRGGTAKPKREKPSRAWRVHQRWQIDFKIDIVLADDTAVTLHTVRDPVGEACIGAVVFEQGTDNQPHKKVTFEQVRTVLRRCFARWNTLPDEVQTDGETVLIGKPQDPFPTHFTLWLKGLGIVHRVIRSGMPTDNGAVERCHRTVNDYAIVGHEDTKVPQLQLLLDQAVDELNFELPSRAKGCAGRPPIIAHPDLLQPRRPFQPEHELALFDLQRVDAYLASFTWQRTVSKTGQITLGGQRQRYSVGRAFARQQVLVRFDPLDRHFVFFDLDQPQIEIGRRPARNLDVPDLTGLATWPDGLGFQQLSLPLDFSEGVRF